METNKKNTVKTKNITKKLLLSSLMLLLLTVTVLSSNSAMAGTGSKYKEYKNEFKNQESKTAYFKMKWLKKNNSELFFYYKTICTAHKFDIDSQFKKLSAETQKMCNQYYSYKGYKNYIYYKNKHQNNSDEEDSFVCGEDTVKDSDNNKYNTVLIGNQCWMAKNINVGNKLALGTTEPADNGTIEKWCYDNDSDICDTDGGLYSWDEAMQYSTDEGAQGICPTDWHIPTDAQYYALENYLKDDGETCDANRSGSGDCAGAGTNLKSSGSPFFYGKLAGLQSGGEFNNRNTYGLFWSSLEYSAANAWIRGLSASETVMRGTRPKEYGFSVRCIKD